MTEISDRYRNLAAQMTETIEAVPSGAWDNPSPCEDWKTRDVVRHLVETAGFFVGRAGGALGDGPSVDDDPVGAWRAARDAVQVALDDPAIATKTYDTPMGESTLEKTMGMFGIGDLLVHRWDIAKGAGLDVDLDAAEVQQLLAAMRPMEDMVRSSGVFGPAVPVPDDADEQTKLIAFTGRQP